MPADQRLDTHDGTGLEIDLRLIVEHELAPRDRLAQVGLDGLALDRVGVHLGPEKLVVVASRVFRLIHGEIGVAQQSFGIRSIARKRGDADARGDAQVVSGDAMRRVERDDDLLRAERRIVRVHDVGEQHEELVSALTAHRIGAAHAGLQSLRHRFKQLIADGVTQRIVDVLEAIEIDVQHRDRAAGAVRPHHRLIEPVAEQGAVRHVRQAVMKRQPRKLVGQLARDRDVVRDHHGADHPALPVVNGRRRGLDGELGAVAAYEHAILGEAHGAVLDDGPRRGRRDRIAGHDVDEPKHVVDGAPRGLRLRPAGHSLRDDVQVRDAAPEVRANHGVADRVERDLRAFLLLEEGIGVLGARLLARLQCTFHGAAIGDVAKYDHRSCELSVGVANRRCAPLDGNSHTARAEKRGIADEIDLFTALPQRLEQAFGPRALVASDAQHTGKRLCEDVGARAADDLGRCRIQIANLARGIDDDDGVGDACEGYLVLIFSRMLQFRVRESCHRYGSGRITSPHPTRAC